MTRRAVFVDRDGVLNEVVFREGVASPPASVADVRVIDGVSSGCADLRKDGWVIVVVTNQPDVARGKARREDVAAINNYLQQEISIDEIRACYHDDQDGCACRKPLAGMLRDAARDLGVDLGASFMIGDTWRDVGAGRSAGCRTILIERPYSGECEPDHRVATFAEAVDVIRNG